MKRLLAFFVGLLLAVPFVSVYASGKPEQYVGTSQTSSQFAGLIDVQHDKWEQGRKGGRIVISQLNDPKSFNVITAAETSTTDVTGELYASLVRRNQFTLQWEPWAAQSWTISDDQKTITFKLKPGMKWSDGQPVTSHDWVDAVNKVYLNDKVDTNQRDGLMVGDKPAKWEALDDNTIRITLPTVYAGIFNLASVSPLPMHIIGPIIDKQGPAAVNSMWGVDSDVTKVVGNGPFELAEYVPGQRVVLHPNPYYFEKDDRGIQLPYLDEVVYVTVPDQDTALQRFLAGQIDEYSLRGQDYATLVNKKADLGIELYNVGPDTATQFLTFNMNPIDGPGDKGIKPPQLTWLSNKTFRQAMAHLIDRQTMIKNIAFGFGYPQYSFIPKFSPYYWQGAEAAALKYDPEAAKKLLDSIGYIDRNGDGIREDPDGNKISLTLETNTESTTRVQIAQMIADDAKKVGIEINFRPAAFNALVTKLVSTYDWNMIVIGLTGSVDPISGANVYPSSGNLHMTEPNQKSPRHEWEKQVDAAWNEANLTTDENQRKDGFKKIQQIWLDEVPWAFTYNAAVMIGIKTKFGNIKPQPIDGYGIVGTLDRIYSKTGK